MHALIPGEVGGLMGLLLGASLITLFEVFDLLIYNWCVKCSDKRSRKREHSYSPTNVSHQ